MDWLYRFPHMNDDALHSLKKTIDEAFRAFTRAYGDGIDACFSPLKSLLIFSERLMRQTLWPIVTLVILAIAWLASRSAKIVAYCIVTLMAIGYFGMWEDTMRTISMIFVCTVLSVVIGIPLGIAMSRADRIERFVNPILDVMQTIPSFVCLILIVMLLGIGRAPGLIAGVIYARPPVVRLTDLDIRSSTGTASRLPAFGSSGQQKLVKVELPLALPAIMAGINQTIMMALAMVVVASMIGVDRLGQRVLKAITNQYFTLGVFNGLAIIGVAMIFDRVSQPCGRRLQIHRDADRLLSAPDNCLIDSYQTSITRQ